MWASEFAVNICYNPGNVFRDVTIRAGLLLGRTQVRRGRAPGSFTMGRLLANGYLEIPPENVLATDSGTVYVDVPCYDSPAVLTERRVVVR